MWFALLLRRIAVLPWRALKALGRGLRACHRGLRAPAGRLGVQVAATTLALAGALAAGWFIVPGAGPAWSYGTEPTPETEEPPLVLSPEGALENAPDPGLPADTEPVGDTVTAESPAQSPTQSPTEAATTPAGPADIESWAASLSALGIPERALVAYGRAELLSAVENPDCNLTWTTLAGIGATETNHGTHGGNRIQADGTTMTEIIGAEYAEMGPMQFLPSTWERWKADGDEDGVHNPHDIDDAVTAAANYLCHDGRDMSTPAGWYEGVFSYNHLDSYVRKVFDRADEYGRKSTA
ncbi:lytic transglycosylase domain-containing protein [Glycomyces sp. TRM65418]|uniref:lytic transglycosylase domain-containing protein n=1 Tax=Glycomyces sp. TRM65418 TaxID=2867006 RepID=UPI001CE5D133|nr:lytic transglycosylase domain-containing protein [Glycomyces sp. TRM65418]MCC3762707.1 lytic transglycosylase domain-containing protein [Glycomyces sp. TRM65418]QZD56742.1 lytic transglycosylase domain-containing protein [Glycomyces sp. TRM65418]